jgi:hypothetical protein
MDGDRLVHLGLVAGLRVEDSRGTRWCRQYRHSYLVERNGHGWGTVQCHKEQDG